jgi:Flp pilus assembly protein TadD
MPSLFSSKKSATSRSTSTAAATPSNTTSFFSKKKATPDLYVATARLCESRGDFAGAADQYEKALKDSPDYVPALLSYAHLQDHQNKLAEATTLYQRAVKANPKEASAFNDLGLCFARRGMAAESLGALGKAVLLQPDKALYRNNVAMVLVDQHRPDDALAQLRAVNNESVANYNVAVLLAQRNQDVLAQAHFRRALELNPSFAEAQQWNDHLSERATAMVSAPPARPQQSAPPDMRLASIPTSMQRPSATSGLPQSTIAGQQPAVPPMPNTMPPAASVPTAMQRPDLYSGPPRSAQAAVQPNRPAVPPTPENMGSYQPSANSELRPLPPVN